MIADFQRMSVDLEREIKTEQDRRYCDPYLRQGRHPAPRNLTRSTDELRVQLKDMSASRQAFEELKKVELLDERDQARER